jgi:hypothetical protein
LVYNIKDWKDYCAPLYYGLNGAIMETEFSTTILCKDGQKREFYFTRINSVAIYFHISVVDSSGRLITATLARDENSQWKLHEHELPNWFINAEPDLGNEVEHKAGR